MTIVRSLAVLWAILLPCRIADATIIVAYRTDAHFVIAADGLATNEVRWATSQLRVCKVYEQAGAIFAMAGTLSPVFDPRQVVREALTGRTSILGAADVLAARLPEFYRSWLGQLRPHELDRIRNGDAAKVALISSLVLGAWESGGPSAAAVDFFVPPGSSAVVRARVGWSCGPAACAHRAAFLGTFPAVGRRMNEFQPALPPEATRATAAESAAALVQLEIDARTPTVGPPISVAQVSADGVSWSVPGACKEPAYSRTPSGVMPQSGGR